MPGNGRFPGPASALPGLPVSVCAGQDGLLAMVMTAGAMRVMVSFSVAWPKVLGDLALRARCRSRSVTVRYLPIALVTVV